MVFSLVLMSFAVGTLIGVTGMGGAALMAPFLILVVGVRPITAVGTDLVYGAVTKIVGAWVHLRQGTVDLPAVRRLAFGSVPGGLLGAGAVWLLPRHAQQAELDVRRAIGGILVVVAVILLARMFFPGEPSSERHRWIGRALPMWGAAVGFCVGFTSVGSGTLLTPVLMLLYPKRPATVVGTDVFHAAILVTVTGLLYAGSRGVEWNLIPALLAGAVPGVLLGSRLAIRIPPWPLRFGLAAVLLFAAYRMF
jgi:uncharacterized membrane protein YfcA